MTFIDAAILLTDRETEKRRWIRGDIVSEIEEHSEGGTVVYVNGDARWVKEDCAAVMEELIKIHNRVKAARAREMMARK